VVPFDTPTMIMINLILHYVSKLPFLEQWFLIIFFPQVLISLGSVTLYIRVYCIGPPSDISVRWYVQYFSPTVVPKLLLRTLTLIMKLDSSLQTGRFYVNLNFSGGSWKEEMIVKDSFHRKTCTNCSPTMTTPGVHDIYKSESALCQETIM
jgi:hypothetical protein